jgi:hypothetical protein
MNKNSFKVYVFICSFFQMKINIIYNTVPVHCRIPSRVILVSKSLSQYHVKTNLWRLIQSYADRPIV